MSAPPTWTDVINKVLEVIRTIIYDLASKVGEYATTIAEVAVGVGIVGILIAGTFRAFPFLRRLLAGVGLGL